MSIFDLIPEELRPVLAVLVTVGGLITPVVTLVRWLTERRASHRSREEMSRSLELLEFIVKCPDMILAGGYADADLLGRAKLQLSKSLEQIDIYFKEQLLLTIPRPLSWPRRFFLFYLPKTWWAGIWHTLYQISLVITGYLIYSFVYWQSDDVEWSAFLSQQHNTFVFMILTVAYYTFMIRYVAVVKDQWDKTIPSKSSSNNQSFIFIYSPVSWQDLIARIIVIGSVSDLFFTLFLKLAPLPLDPDTKAQIPTVPTWMNYYWISVAWLTPAIAYWWARIEYKTDGLETEMPSARNRFWFMRKTASPHEWLVGLLFLYLLIDPFLSLVQEYQVFDVYKNMINALVQKSGMTTSRTVDVGSAFAYGMLLSTVTDIFWSLMTLYGLYRIGLSLYRARPGTVSSLPATGNGASTN